MTAPERVHAHVQVLLIKYKQRLTLHRQTLKYIYYGKTLNSLQFCLRLGENKGWEMAHRLRRAQHNLVPGEHAGGDGAQVLLSMSILVGNQIMACACHVEKVFVN
jgi:hypothetical protein